MIVIIIINNEMTPLVVYTFGKIDNAQALIDYMRVRVAPHTIARACNPQSTHMQEAIHMCVRYGTLMGLPWETCM